MRSFLVRALAISLLSSLVLMTGLVLQEQRASAFPHDNSQKPQELTALDSAGKFNLYEVKSSWTDQNSNSVNFNKFSGKPALVGFIYTTCVLTCDILTLQMKELESLLPQKWQGKIQFITFSIDPETDTPEKLHKYAARFDALSESWSFLTSSKEATKEMTKQFSFYYQKNGDVFLHSEMLAVIDKNGNLVHQFWGGYSPEKVVTVFQQLKDKGLF